MVRGAIYLRRREYEKAVAAFTEAIRLNPNLDQAFRGRAAAKKVLEDTSGAQRRLESCLGTETLVWCRRSPP